MGIPGIKFDGPLQRGEDLPGSIKTGPTVKVRVHGLLHQFPGAQLGWRLPTGPRHFGLRDLQRERTGNITDNLVLNIEDIRVESVILFGPQVTACSRIDELHRRTHFFADAAYATLYHVTHPELLSDLANVGRLSLVGEGRIASHHVQMSRGGKARDDVFRHAIGEKRLFAVV